ncbi:MAG: carbohydrate kinase family protein [Bacteroidota bacterium]
MNKIKISGIGCTLIDYLYNNVSFTSPEIQPYLSQKDGDGGISPGRLVFTDELESFSGESYNLIIDKITGGRSPDARNIGGPAVVSMIHAAQMLKGKAEFYFTGAIGEDETGKDLLGFLEKTPLSADHLQIVDASTPFTHVLSDPGFNNGEGERTFINNIGAAFGLKAPAKDFFEADICVFGGTALVPGIHDQIDYYLKAARSKGAYTVVNTVYDFRNQKKAPETPWPLGKEHNAIPHIDLLIMDLEEALRISGRNNGDSALNYFIDNGARAVVITEGARDIKVFASGELYLKEIKKDFPVSQKAISDLKCTGVRGDTTGCGDNFVGGMISSLAEQLIASPDSKPDIVEMLRLGRASGGFACFYLGGTYFEKEEGEKRQKVERYLD